MAVALTDNLNYKGKKPDFVRQQYDTLEAMTLVNDNQMPPMYLAYCLETQKVYLYNKNNEPDLILGRFREFESGSGAGSQVSIMPAATSSEYNKVYQYIGETTTSYTKGYFYVCQMEEGEYFWEQLATGSVRKLTDEEIDEIFDSVNGVH